MDDSYDDQSVGARWPAYMEELRSGNRRDQLLLGIPALDDQLHLPRERKQLVVIALPWEPAGETPFVIAQAFAKQGAAPLCIYPSWSPYWDGSLDVRRLEEEAVSPVPYDRFRTAAGPHQPILIDQFSRLYWDVSRSHASREEVVELAGRDMHSLSQQVSAPVVVFVRRRTRDVVQMSGNDLRSDGALEYEADAVVMIDPHPATSTADMLVVKHQNGPTGLFAGVPWPVLPRTVYRRNST
jgi:hypothetical protein